MLGETRVELIDPVVRIDVDHCFDQISFSLSGSDAGTDAPSFNIPSIVPMNSSAETFFRKTIESSLTRNFDPALILDLRLIFSGSTILCFESTFTSSKVSHFLSHHANLSLSELGARKYTRLVESDLTPGFAWAALSQPSFGVEPTASGVLTIRCVAVLAVGRFCLRHSPEVRCYCRDTT